MIHEYYIQHRRRASSPEHRVRVFFRPLDGEDNTPDHSVLIGTLQLSLATGKVTCDVEDQTHYIEEVTGPAIELLGEIWGFVADGIRQTKEQ